MMELLEYASEKDTFFDYCHCMYEPEISFAGKMRSVNLLLDCLHANGDLQGYYDIIYSIRESIGINNTVWGIKKVGTKFFYELYFYNQSWKQSERNISITYLLKYMQKYFSCNIKADEKLNYFMFSIGLLPQYLQEKRLNEIHVYSGKFCYQLTHSGFTLKNHYSFYNPKTEKEMLIKDIKKSVFVDYSMLNLNQILLPEFVDCKSICRCHKPKSDGIYFSGLNIEQFIIFLERFSYPDAMTAFIKHNKTKLEHLKYDIGFDYIMEDNNLKIIKDGYYGTF